jgi:hypothetical protein
VHCVEEDEVAERDALVVVGELLQQVEQLVLGVAQRGGGAVQVGLDVGLVGGEGLLADRREDLDVAVGVHQIPGGLDHAGLHVHPGGAREPAQGLVELVDEQKHAAVQRADEALERALEGVDHLVDLADGEREELFDHHRRLDGAALEEAA